MDPIELPDGRMFVPGVGTGAGRVSKKKFPKGVIQYVNPDGRLVLKIGEGPKSIRMVDPAKRSDLFEKPKSDDIDYLFAHVATKVAHVGSLGIVPSMESGEQETEYARRAAMPLVALGMSGMMPVPEAAPPGGNILAKALPYLQRAGAIAGGTAAASAGTQYLTKGDVDIPKVAAESVGLPVAELGGLGAGKLVGGAFSKFFRPHIPSGKNLALDLAKPENFAFTKLMEDAGIPVTKGQATQNVALRPMEEAMSGTAVGRKMIQDLGEKGSAAKEAYTKKIIFGMTKEAGSFGRAPGDMSSIELGKKVATPILRLRSKVGELKNAASAAMSKAKGEVSVLEAEKKAIDEANSRMLGSKFGKSSEEGVIKPGDLSPAYQAAFRKQGMKEFDPAKQARIDSIKADIADGNLERFGFSGEKKELLESLTTALDPKNSPGLISLVSKERPEDIARVIEMSNPSEFTSYLRVLDSDAAGAVLNESQIERGRAAIQLAFTRNVMKTLEGTGEAPAGEEITKLLQIKPSAVIAVSKGDFGSVEIPATLRKIFKGNNEALKFLVTLTQTDRLDRYRAYMTHGYSKMMVLGRIVRNVMAPYGMSKMVFTPVGREWISDTMKLLNKSQSSWIKEHAFPKGVAAPLLRSIETLYVVKKAVDAYWDKKSAKAKRPKNADTTTLLQQVQ